MKKGTILVTGGAGYIGTHTVVTLVEAGYNPIIVDNFSNSKPEAIKRVGKIVGREIECHAFDLRDEAKLDALFKQHTFDGVIHFAGLKAVGESVQKPLEYYSNNIGSTLSLLQAMKTHGCGNLVFSSSATVYGDPQKLPIDEDAPLSATNPYGRSKLMIEEILRDLARSYELLAVSPTVAALLDSRADRGGSTLSDSAKSDSETKSSKLKANSSLAKNSFRCLLLRYFNPVGAHASGTIGEDPNGIPNNLFPYISQVAVGKLPSLKVYGNDYPTPDGTGVRDYIHVVDLAEGHVRALDYMLEQAVSSKLLAISSDSPNPVSETTSYKLQASGSPESTGYQLKANSSGTQSYCLAINLGTGLGYSVLDAIKAFEQASGKTISHTIAPRRPGDIAACYAKADKAKTLLGWSAQKTLADMCADAWRWQSSNPKGYVG